MQNNKDLPITITGRHISITEPIKEYCRKKIQNLHFEYPKIVDAKAILEVSNYRQKCEILLFCANHISIEASSETNDLYASIDQTISKISRRMRKFKTRLLKSQRKRKQSIRAIAEQVYKANVLEQLEEESQETEQEPDIQPYIIHNENYKINPMYLDEAIMNLEMSDRNFIIFENQKNHKIGVVYRRKDLDYSYIELGEISD